MKYTMSCQQPLTLLRDADEIKFEYRHRARIDNLIEEEKVINPNIYIYISQNETDIDWNELKKYNTIFNLRLAFENIDLLTTAIQNGFFSFWSYPIYTFNELRALLNLGVVEVLLGAPLYFDLPKVKDICAEYGAAEIRLIANECQNLRLPLEHPECGTFIRPEDVSKYEPYVSHLEFVSKDITQEKTLINIYKSGVWPGNLNLLLNNLNYNIDNRIIAEDFAEKRLTCRHRCQRDSSCHFCQAMFGFYATVQSHKQDYITTT